jgi:hypothetical protein
MKLQLHAKLASGGKVRIWVGLASAVGNPGDLVWKAQGLASGAEARLPSATLRPFQPVRDPGQGPVAWTGVYEFEGFQAGETVRVRAHLAGNLAAELETRVLPEALPSTAAGAGNSWFRILMVSCYHSATADGVGIQSAWRSIKAEGPPDMAIFMGDQVYLDLPWYTPYPDNQAWLERKFESLYKDNWFGERDDSYANLLRSAPHVCLPDDHEYWNNFPEAAPHIQNSYTADGRGRWTRAAGKLYQAFQNPDVDAAAQEITVGKVSIFLADSRTHRRRGGPNAYAENTLAALREWVDQVNETRNTGIFVTGQSLLDEKAGWIGGRVGDMRLANYQDHGAIWRELLRLERPFLLLTGDVHFGRMVRVETLSSLPKRGWEIIVSPASLCQGGSLPKLFARDWKRHGEPRAAAAKLEVRGSATLRTSTQRHPFQAKINGQKGDHLGVLSLRTRGGVLEAKMDYYPATADLSLAHRWRWRGDPFLLV